MCVMDIEEIYDYIENNNVDDICDLVHYALSAPDDLKLNWLDVLSNDKMVDLLFCKIKEKRHFHNMVLIRKYYDKCFV